MSDVMRRTRVSKKAEASLADLVPTTWLDPLLTGSDAVISSPPFNHRDIERLLLAVQARIRRAELEIANS